MNTLELAAGNGQIARLLGAATEKDGVEAFRQRLHGNIYAHVRVSLKDHAFGLHLLDAAIDDMFFELEIWNTVAEQSADAIVLLKNCNGVAGAAQLLRCSQA